MPEVTESRERYLLYASPRAARQTTRRPSRQPVDPAQPWTSDHPWHPQGMNPDDAPDSRRVVLGRAAILALIALLNLGLASPYLVLKIVIALCDLGGLLILFDSLLKIVHWLRHPRTRMRWTTFPAFLGGRLEGTVTLRPRQHVMSSIQVRLRCVRDERVEQPAPDGPTSHLEPYVIYEQSFETLPPGETLRELPLSFDLPADLPGNDLGRDEATYWQVALKIPVPGPDVEAVFLAPVYVPGGAAG
ncbi:MAG TPA: hypothetical protein VIA62_06730 [Thermoanaerobaculia bacterium]|jgi:hypothetical protein|nr:hypothetical protein [Thermoanaerobaculia bacterium]